MDAGWVSQETELVTDRATSSSPSNSDDVRGLASPPTNQPRNSTNSAVPATVEEIKEKMRSSLLLKREQLLSKLDELDMTQGTVVTELSNLEDVIKVHFSEEEAHSSPDAEQSEAVAARSEQTARVPSKADEQEPRDDDLQEDEEPDESEDKEPDELEDEEHQDGTPEQERHRSYTRRWKTIVVKDREVSVPAHLSVVATTVLKKLKIKGAACDKLKDAFSSQRFNWSTKARRFMGASITQVPKLSYYALEQVLPGLMSALSAECELPFDLVQFAKSMP